MKVACYFNGRTNVGGAERRISRIMNLIAQQGVEVTVVFYLYEEIDKIIREYESLVGFPVHIKFVGFNSHFQILRYVIKEKFDTIFYTGPYKSMLAFFIGGLIGGSQTVLLQVSTGPSVRQFKTKLEMLEFDFVAHLSDRIDCLFPSTRINIARRYKRTTVTTTPCPATRLDLFKPLKKKKYLAFVSRWVEGKNIEVFAESMLLIEDYLYEHGYQVWLCGSSSSGQIEKNVKRIIDKAKYRDIFVIPGYVKSEDVLPYADVFYSIQDINNYPSQSLLEAIASGCYIIASDEGDTRSVVKDDFGVCSSIDPKEIAMKTIEYIEKKQTEKDKIVVAANNFAKEHFDINTSVMHYKSIIENHC